MQGFNKKVENIQKGEGCNLSGFMSVNKVRG